MFTLSKPGIGAILFLAALQSSCKKILEIDFPNNRIADEQVFTTDATASAAVLGMYYYLEEGFASGRENSLAFLSGLSSDELVHAGTDITYLEYQNNNLNPKSINIFSNWEYMYKIVYQANAVIEGLNASSAVLSKRNHLMGEALFGRAFTYFYLFNTYGNVPLLTTTDQMINRSAGRSDSAAIYSRIITDLETAYPLLDEAYPNSGQRTRVNRYAAQAFLARVYLYAKKYDKAEEMAAAVIAQENIYKLTPLEEVFLKNGKEAILQWRPNTGMGDIGYVFEGRIFSRERIPDYLIQMRTGAIDFYETDDQRRKKWTDTMTIGSEKSYYPSKYKMGDYNLQMTEYSMVIRLAEMFLIRAEARAMQGNFTGVNSAASDINIIRNRAGLGNTTATTEADLLNAIIQERKIELFSEWGHRWHDLKRWGKATEVLAPLKGANWQPTDALYPIPLEDMLKNPNLRPQNPGYN
jgi:hypothetical protein